MLTQSVGCFHYKEYSIVNYTVIKNEVCGGYLMILVPTFKYFRPPPLNADQLTWHPKTEVTKHLPTPYAANVAQLTRIPRHSGTSHY